MQERVPANRSILLRSMFGAVARPPQFLFKPSLFPRSHMKVCIGLVFVLILLFGLPACNLQTGPGTPLEQEIPSLSDVPMVHVSTATSCRVGPGQVYDLIGTLIPGQEVEAVGRSAAGDYWLIQYPGSPAVQCWLEGASVTEIGDFQNLPIPTLPPTPTPTPVFSPGSGCPSPVPSGPTPVSCGGPPPGTGCPSPVPNGPSPVYCGPLLGSGCPSPVPSGPTPVSCGGPLPGSGCPSPVPNGPTPVYCGPSLGSGCPTPFGGGPTPFSCSSSRSVP